MARHTLGLVRRDHPIRSSHIAIPPHQDPPDRCTACSGDRRAMDAKGRRCSNGTRRRSRTLELELWTPATVRVNDRHGNSVILRWFSVPNSEASNLCLQNTPSSMASQTAFREERLATVRLQTDPVGRLIASETAEISSESAEHPPSAIGRSDRSKCFLNTGPSTLLRCGESEVESPVQPPR